MLDTPLGWGTAWRLLTGSLLVGERNTITARLAAHVERMVGAALGVVPQTAAVRRLMTPAIESARPRYHAPIVRLVRICVEYSTALFWLTQLTLVAAYALVALASSVTPHTPHADPLATYQERIAAHEDVVDAWVRSQPALRVPTDGSSFLVPLWGGDSAEMHDADIVAHIASLVAEGTGGAPCVEAREMGLPLQAWWLRVADEAERAWWECDSVLLNPHFERGAAARLAVMHQRVGDAGRWTRCEIRDEALQACILRNE